MQNDSGRKAAYFSGESASVHCRKGNNVDEVVKAHIKSLRQKLSDDDSVQIKNVWGVGYRFCYNRK